MHQIQKDLLSLSRNLNLGERSLREIGHLIGVSHPEKVKHHLKQLEKKGFIEIDKGSGTIRNLNSDISKENKFINIPIVGAANCGPAQLLAVENIEGHLKLSSSIVRGRKLFAVKAEGNSMNRAKIHGASIDEGDYVIVDLSDNSPALGDYVLAVIDGAAMIKKFHPVPEQGAIYFVSESTTEYPPIMIAGEDISQVYINGKVVQVVKAPTNL